MRELDDDERAAGRREPGLSPRHPRARSYRRRPRGGGNPSPTSRPRPRRRPPPQPAFPRPRSGSPSTSTPSGPTTHIQRRPRRCWTRSRTASSWTRFCTGGIRRRRARTCCRRHRSFDDGDMELISAPLDFVGINYYSPFYVKRAAPTDANVQEVCRSPVAMTWSCSCPQTCRPHPWAGLSSPRASMTF